MRDTLQRVWKRLGQASLLMVGVPDYDAYCDHMREHHPETPLMSRAQWIARAQEARFGGKKIGKCPC